MIQHTLTVRTPTLEIAYRTSGPVDGIPVVLMHGFPDDPGAYDGTLDDLEALGCRVFAPWLRGYGPTRFLDAATPRSGQQAALGADLLAFMDALDLDSAVLVGYDWGGRAACIVAALWPERCRGLVTVGAYNIQDIANAESTGAGVGGISILVPVVLQHRARSRGPRAGPARHLQVALAAVVADVVVRR